MEGTTPAIGSVTQMIFGGSPYLTLEAAQTSWLWPTARRGFREEPGKLLLFYGFGVLLTAAEALMTSELDCYTAIPLICPQTAPANHYGPQSLVQIHFYSINFY